MKTLRVGPVNAELDANFKLARLIADWPAAQTKFIAGMAERLKDRNWQPIVPADFTMRSGASLDEARCQLRIFQGACNVILEADGLKLSFRNATRNFYPTLAQVFSRCSDWLASDLGEHGRDWAFFNSREHVQAWGDDGIGEAEAHLNQFSLKDAALAMQPKAGVRYVPSARVILSDESGGWVLRRTIEKSEWIVDGGLYVETSIHLPSPEPSTLKDMMTLLAHLDGLADEATGLRYEY